MKTEKIVQNKYIRADVNLLAINLKFCRPQIEGHTVVYNL